LIKVSNVLQDIYHEANSQLFLVNLKQDIPIGVLPVMYIHFLYVWLSHVVYVCWRWQRNHKKIQKSWGATKHTEGFGCYSKAVLMRRIHRNNAPIATSLYHRHTGALIIWGKMKICRKNQTFEAIG